MALIPNNPEPDADQAFLGGALAAGGILADPRYKTVNIAQERAQLRREIADLDIEAAQLAARKVALKSKLSELRQK